MLDIDNIDLAMGKMMEQGPVLVITFNSQQILCVRDRTGKVIEGSPDKVSILPPGSFVVPDPYWIRIQDLCSFVEDTWNLCTFIWIYCTFHI